MRTAHASTTRSISSNAPAPAAAAIAAVEKLKHSRSHFLRPVWNQRLGWNKERDIFSHGCISPVRSPIVRTASELGKGKLRSRGLLLPAAAAANLRLPRRSNGVIHSPRELPCYAGGHGPPQPQPQDNQTYMCKSNATSVSIFSKTTICSFFNGVKQTNFTTNQPERLWFA